MNARRLESGPVREAVRGRWVPVLQALAPELDAALVKPGRHVSCPVHGGLAKLSAAGSTHNPSSPAARIKLSAYTAPERWTCRSAPLGNSAKNACIASGPRCAAA